MCSVKTYTTRRLSTKCYLNIILFIWTLLPNNFFYIYQGLWSIMFSRFCVRSNSLRWTWCNRPWSIIHCMPCRISYRFFIHSNLCGSLDLPILVLSEARRSLGFFLPIRKFNSHSPKPSSSKVEYQTVSFLLFGMIVNLDSKARILNPPWMQ
jgi:hypothetical protein